MFTFAAVVAALQKEPFYKSIEEIKQMSVPMVKNLLRQEKAGNSRTGKSRQQLPAILGGSDLPPGVTYTP